MNPLPFILALIILPIELLAFQLYLIIQIQPIAVQSQLERELAVPFHQVKAHLCWE